jgi:hypothetical protein
MIRENNRMLLLYEVLKTNDQAAKEYKSLNPTNVKPMGGELK